MKIIQQHVKYLHAAFNLSVLPSDENESNVNIHIYTLNATTLKIVFSKLNRLFSHYKITTYIAQRTFPRYIDIISR